MERRPVMYWTKDKSDKKEGFFHVWGSRKDEYNEEFFAVIEDADTGECLELDAIQIKFCDK